MIINNKAIVEDIILKNGFIDLIAHGTSMLPTIADGQKIRIVKRHSISVNDIIAYWSEDENNVIVHRVVYMHNDKVFTKGDNCPEIDRVVNICRIIGKYDERTINNV